MIRGILIALAALSFWGPEADAEDRFGRVELGQTREEIQRLLGPPSQRRVERKTSDVIWGAEESIWSDIPLGAGLEIWQYDDRNGRWTLYFVEQDGRLTYKVYSPAGVVYESSE